MRKIKSKYEYEKKRKRNNLILGGILIIVMFGSVFGIVVNSFGNKEDKSNVEYNGYGFYNQNGLWYSLSDNPQYIFKYLPNETGDSKESIKNINNYYNKPLYIYSEDYNSEAEVYNNLKQSVERMQPACFNEEKCDGDYPIKSCSDNFIIIQKGPINLNQSENCVYISGEDEELVKLTDEFLFKVIGIKQ